MTAQKHKTYTIQMPTKKIKVVEYHDGSFELACMVCDEPMLIGKDDYFNVVEDKNGKPVAFLCVPCAKKAKDILEK